MKAIRYISGVALFLVCFFSLRAQQKGTFSEESSLYRRALSATVDEMAKSWGSIDDSVLNTRIRTDYSHLIVEQGDEITEGLPTRLGDHQIEYLDVQGLVGRFKKLRKEFAVLRIHPMRDSGRSFSKSKLVFTGSAPGRSRLFMRLPIGAMSNFVMTAKSKSG